MSELANRLANLSPAKRRLLVQQLAARGVAVGEEAGPALEGERFARTERGPGPYPLSFAQERLWFLNQLEPEAPLYAIANSLVLSGPLARRALARALGAAVARHESLRTVFGVEDDQPVQRILPAEAVLAGGALRLPLVDLVGLGTADRERVARALEGADGQRPFALETGPLLRATLVREGAEVHRLLLSVHHIVFDGWSLGVLLGEVQAFYAAALAGTTPSLPEPTQFLDFALWQRRYLDASRQEAQLAYWRQALAGAPRELALPTDRPRAERRGVAGSMVRVVVGAGPLSELRRLAAERRQTLLVPLVAAFAVVLARLSGQSDLVLGTPVANRRERELDSVIGFLVNNLVLRLDLTRAPSFESLLEQAQEVVLGALAHQDLPFERLVAALNPERSLQRQPMFQVTLALQNQGLGPLALPGLALEPQEPKDPTEDFDLTVMVSEEAGGLALRLRYSTELFDRTTIERLGRQLRRVLERAPAAADTPVFALPLLDRAERHQLEREWNDTALGPRPAARAATLHGCVAAWATEAPARIALVQETGDAGGDEHLSYGELERRAWRVARALIAAGTGPGELVGVALDRSVERIVALVGALAAGAAYVPLDPAQPAERLAALVEDSGVRRVLVASDGAPALPAALERYDVAALAASGEPAIAGARTPDGAASLAYVLFTSGSTGRPKPVPVPHGAVLRLLAEPGFFPPGSRPAASVVAPVVAHLAPLAFDASTLEIWSALATGARLVSLSPGALDLAELARTYRQQRVTTSFLTAELFHQMVDEHLESLLELPRLIAGGDVVSPRHVERLLAAGGRLGNGYGPTENTVLSTLAQLRPTAGRALPIGRPIATSTAYVLDAHGELGPVGVEGDLHVGGAGLAWGYLARPALTAVAFVPDPFATEPGARLYRTGDRAAVRPDGELAFHGRRDRQVKIRGFRIELTEIEAALDRHPAVARAVVLLHEDGTGKRLIAYVAPRREPWPSPAELRAYLRERLPEPLVPASFELLAALPLLPSGKLDRARLPAPGSALAEVGGGRPFVAPRTPLEELLAQAWCELLGVERVGLGDSFFDLGGHSLLATRLVSRLRRELGVELPLRALFEAPTLEGLVRAVDRASQEAAGGAPPPIEPAPRDRPLPLSFAQERLWFLERMQRDAVAVLDVPLFNVHVAARFVGRLDLAALAASFAAIVARHEALRTSFGEHEGRPVQRIAAPGRVALPYLDLAALAAADREATALALASREAAHRFDLEHGPLVRVLVVALGPDADGRPEHVALVVLHHIVADGWSMERLLAELAAHYRGFVGGLLGPTLAPLPVQYADFALWQRRWLAGERLAAEIAYWREQLAGLPPALTLPLDRPRPAEPSFRGAARAFTVPAVTVAGLRRLAREARATLFMALLGAFQAQLGRLSGARDLAVGTPIAGRRRHEVEELIGFFVNMLVLRADLRRSPSFARLLAAMRETTLAAYVHQDLSFEKLVEELNPERDRSHTPLFQVSFALQSPLAGQIELPGVELVPFGLASHVVKYDLVLQLWEVGDELQGVLEYATDLFDGTSAERMVRGYQRLLASAVAAPDRPLALLDLLDPAERQQLLGEWAYSAAGMLPDGAAGELPNLSLPRLFAAAARRDPEAPAVVYPEATLSYRELAGRAAALARRLRQLGVGPEARVGLALPRSAELAVAILGILEAGGAYVPLDLELPPSRLAFLLADADIRVVVAQEQGVLPDDVLLVEVGSEALPADSFGRGDDLGGADRGGDGLAYVVYTSGSTGEPKGVGVSHRAVARLVLGADYLPPRPGRRVAQAATPTFDAYTFELWSPLLSGGTVIGVPRPVLLDPPALAAFLRATQTDALFLTTALFNQIVRQVPTAFASLEALLFGGEAVDPASVARLLAAGPPRRLLHVYGPTECTTFATWEEVHAAPKAGETVPIGRALAHTATWVVDADLQLVAPGVEGQLVLGGPGVARGYLGRPRATATSFLPDPFSGEPGARLYATGDRVRRRADGRIDFVGRVDFQVKVRGFRIELPEIEAAMLAHPAVRQAVALVRNEGGEKTLLAYAAAPGLEAEALRRFLAERLPEYMVPLGLFLLPELPLNANGKIDRRALPDPAELTATSAGLASAPADISPVRELLHGMWRELFPTSPVAAESHFFELGGHSLLALQLLSRVKEGFGVDVPLRVLFDQPTFAGFAAELAAAIGRDAGLAHAPIVPAPRDQPLPMSFAQQRLWLLDELGLGAAAAYNIPLAVELVGALDVAALAWSLGQVVRRHESLRTVFRRHEGQPVQVVLPYAALTLPVVDLSALAASSRRSTVLALAQSEEVRSFDLGRGPLQRQTLVRLEARRHALLLTQHHIVSDGWSLGVLLREVEVLYRAFHAVEKGHVALPPLALQYGDFAVWQRQALAGDRLERLLAYWRGALLPAAPPHELPTDRPRGATETFRGASVGRRLDPAASEALRAFCRREGVTLFMALVAGFQMLVARQAGQRTVTVGTPVANRDRLELEGLIGFFVNTLVLATDVDPALPARRHLARVRETTLGAFAHQDLPFQRLVEELQPRRDLQRSPLFQLFCVLQNTPRPALALPGVELVPLDVATRTVKFELSLGAVDDTNGLALAFDYNADLFDPTTAERWLARYVRLLGELVARPEAAVAALPLESAAERHQMLVEWNDTAPALHDPARHQTGATIHALVAAQAARAPERVALLGPGEEVRYGELVERARRLAWVLRRHGLGPEDRVGVFLEPSPRLAVALLAVLEAGGAYVPMDVGHPAERLRFQLEDAAVKLVLCERTLAARLPQVPGCEVLALDELGAELAESATEGTDRLPARASGASLAYVIHTSGSTGRPKGVAVPHAGIVRLVQGGGVAPITPEDVVFQITNPTFDVAAFEIWGALGSGAALAFPPPGPPTLEELGAALARSRASVLWLTSGLFAVAVEHHLEALAGVRQLIVGGDVVPVAQARRVLAELPGTRLVNGYGPTENAVFTTRHTIGPACVDRPSIPIGRPIGGSTAVVLDGRFAPVPAGSIGELASGGLGVARGYLGRPGLTAERFVPDAVSGVPGARLYRTGDLARFLPDGTLEFFGRRDLQVKVRGFRIELGEVQAALAALPAVAEAVVVAPVERGERRLVAYVVAAAGEAPNPARPEPAQLDPAELARALRRFLPEYMVPEAFVVLPALPLLPSGKVDRAALPSPWGEGAAVRRTGAGFVPPRAPLEATLARIWAEVLDVEAVGVHDNFFDLGGHSLKVTEVIERLRQELGRSVPPILFFERPTVAGLAEALAEDAPAAAERTAEATSASQERGEARRAALQGRLQAAASVRRRLGGAADDEEEAW